MFAQRPIPPPFQFVLPFLVAAAAMQMLAIQHASAQSLGAFAPLRTIFSTLG